MADNNAENVKPDDAARFFRLHDIAVDQRNGKLSRVAAHVGNKKVTERQKTDGVDITGDRHHANGKNQMAEIIAGHEKLGNDNPLSALEFPIEGMAWMAGTSPAMTKAASIAQPDTSLTQPASLARSACD
jgi:hypothetical protein